MSFRNNFKYLISINYFKRNFLQILLQFNCDRHKYFVIFVVGELSPTQREPMREP